MRVATLIQQQFLPRELPQLPDWQVAAYYGPARAVGGDFYDFIALPRRPDRDRRGRRHRQGRPGGAGHGPHAVASCAARRRGCMSPGEGPGSASTSSSAGDAGADVRHLPVHGPGARDRPGRLRERGPQPAVRPVRRTASSELRATGMPLGPDARDGLRASTRRSSRPGEQRAALQRRARRGARARPATMFGFPGLRERWRPGARRQRAARRPARRAHALHGPRLGPGGRHHARRSSSHRGRGDASRTSRGRARGGCGPGPPAEADDANCCTSSSPARSGNERDAWSASRRPSRGSASRRPASSGSRPPSARRR